MSCVIKGQFYKRNYRKMTWSFSYNLVENSMVKKIESHNMIVLYPNPCYDEVCYKGNAL